jgi:hypothetical protein
MPATPETDFLCRNFYKELLQAGDNGTIVRNKQAPPFREDGCRFTSGGTVKLGVSYRCAAEQE